MGQGLSCSLAWSLNYDAENFCWETDFRPSHTEAKSQPLHSDFQHYLQVFHNGLAKYKVKSKNFWGYNWYKSNIEDNITGLQKTYPKIKSTTLQKEALEIAHALSESWQNRHLLCLHHYLLQQNRLIQLKNALGVEVGNDIHYNTVYFFLLSWSRGGK